MRERNGITLGGLVLQTVVLRNILNEKDCIGLAFAAVKQGSATNVDLKVYKVAHNGKQFVGQYRPIKGKKGAKSVEGNSSSVDAFKFEFSSELIRCKFDFAYISKADFEYIMSNGEKEVFIGGGLKSYGELSLVTGQWFTLTMSPRAIVRRESIRNLESPPQMKLLESCPPRWTIKANDYVITDNGKEIIFNAVDEENG